MDFNILLRPLNRIEDFQRFIGYMKAIPDTVKNRIQHLTAVINSNINKEEAFTEQEISTLVQTLERILPRFGDNPSAINNDIIEYELGKNIQNGIFDLGIVNILPPINTCCGALKSCSQKPCTVYRNLSKPVVGIMHHMKCQKCHTVYKTSTYKCCKLTDPECYYKDVLTAPYFMSTCDTVFANDLMNSVDIDIFRKSASFESIAFAYNDLYVGKQWMLKSDTGALILDRRRLAEAWYKRAFISMRQRYCDVSEMEFITSDHLEDTLEKHLNQLWTSFTKDWSSHTDRCNHKVCSKALLLDGHMKGTRSVCAEKKSETKTSDELGDIVVGCKKTPGAGSIYCKKHANTAPKENPSNENVQCRDEQVDDLRCNTRKDACLVKKNKTSGICAAVYNCGIIVGVTELFGCESLSQVYMFLVWLAKEMLNFPHLLAYDDACHLKKFVNNPIRADKTEYSKLLATIRMVVDKMHFVNHIDKWCRRNVNPYTDDQFKDINTEACEQTFHFISKFKYATKHMSYAKYNIFMLYICTTYNIDRLVRNTKRCKYDF